MRIARACILVLLVPLSAAYAERGSVLLVHDASRQPGLNERHAISALSSLLGHFDCRTEVLPAEEYRGGDAGRHDALIYLGLRATAVVPETLLADCYDEERAICWLGEGLDQLAGRFSLGRFGFRVEGPLQERSPRRVVYKGRTYWRDGSALPVVTITRPDVCAALATVQQGDTSAPYVTRSGDLYYFAEAPLPLSPRHNAWLVLADQLHEFLEQRHEMKRSALLCIGPVTPESDSVALAALIRMLQADGVPFAVSVRPSGPALGNGSAADLSRQRGLVSVLRGAQRAGASIVASTAAGELSGGAGTDEDSADGGRDARAQDWAGADRSHMGSVLRQLARCGLYPLAWEAPEDVVCGPGPSAVTEVSSTVWATRDYEAARSGEQGPPFLIVDGDRRILPDSVMRLREGRGEVEAIVDAANRQSVVPDPWVTAGIAPEAPLDAVGLLVSGIRAAGYDFADLREMACSVKGESLHISSVREPTPLTDLLLQGWHAILLGPEAGSRRHYEDPERDRRGEALVHPGTVVLAYPPGGRPKTVLSLEGDLQEVTDRLVRGIAQIVVVFAAAASLVLLVIYLSQVALNRRT